MDSCPPAAAAVPGLGPLVAPVSFPHRICFSMMPPWLRENWGAASTPHWRTFLLPLPAFFSGFSKDPEKAAVPAVSKLYISMTASSKVLGSLHITQFLAFCGKAARNCSIHTSSTTSVNLSAGLSHLIPLVLVTLASHLGPCF